MAFQVIKKYHPVLSLVSCRKRDSHSSFLSINTLNKDVDKLTAEVNKLETRIRDLELRFAIVEITAKNSEDSILGIKGSFTWATRLIGGFLIIALLGLLVSKGGLQ